MSRLLRVIARCWRSDGEEPLRTWECKHRTISRRLAVSQARPQAVMCPYGCHMREIERNQLAAKLREVS